MIGSLQLLISGALSAFRTTPLTSGPDLSATTLLCLRLTAVVHPEAYGRADFTTIGECGIIRMRD